MKKGQVLEGTVEKIIFPNKGVLYMEGKRCIVKNVLPGQKIRFSVNKLRSGNAEGRLLEVLEKSIIENTSEQRRIHPTQKPVRLLERLLFLVIPKYKQKEDITILDPFGGSFSTMEAVYNMGLQGISSEIEKEYYLNNLIKNVNRIEVINNNKTLKIFIIND